MTDIPLFDDEPQPKPVKRSNALGGVILLVSVTAAIILFGVQLWQQNQIQPQPGVSAPNFDIVPYHDGEPHQLSDYRGQVVVLNFWGDWCPPCHAEAEELQQIHDDYQARGVTLLGINWLDTESDALGFIAQYDLTYPNAPDIGERIANLYRINAAPETFIIGADGVITHFFKGQVSYAQLAAALDEVLASNTG